MRDLKSYHVYDGLSQTPQIPGRGVQAGHVNVYLMRYCHCVTLASITKHYDWGQREPTSYISLFDNEEVARKAARCRAHQLRVYDPATGQWRHWGYVAIAVISGKELALERFIFSLMDLISEHMLGSNNSLLRHLNKSHEGNRHGSTVNSRLQDKAKQPLPLVRNEHLLVDHTSIVPEAPSLKRTCTYRENGSFEHGTRC